MTIHKDGIYIINIHRLDPARFYKHSFGEMTMKQIQANEQQILARAIRSVGFVYGVDDMAIQIYYFTIINLSSILTKKNHSTRSDPSDSFLILLRGNATIWVDTVSGDL